MNKTSGNVKRTELLVFFILNRSQCAEKSVCRIRFEAGMNKTSRNVKRTELLVFFILNRSQCAEKSVCRIRFEPGMNKTSGVVFVVYSWHGCCCSEYIGLFWVLL